MKTFQRYILISFLGLTVLFGGGTAEAASAVQLQNTYISSLAARSYEPGEFTVGEQIDADTFQATYRISYQSDGLLITGLLALPVVQSPRATGDLRPWPGIVICHGYYNPRHYFSGQGTQSTAAGLAREGYVVLVPDYRGYGGSQGAHSVYTPGEEYDVLNALATLRSMPFVDNDRLGLIGYSWGGGFAVKAAEAAGADIACLVDFYGQLGGVTLGMRERQYFMQLGITESADAEELFQARSPLFHTERIDCPVLIIHGSRDPTVSPEQSRALYQRLRANEKDVELLMLPQEAHAFGDNYENPGRSRLLEFLKEHLGNRYWFAKWQKRGKQWISEE